MVILLRVNQVELPQEVSFKLEVSEEELGRVRGRRSQLLGSQGQDWGVGQP